jgi:replication factor C subunit 3/5
MNINYSLWVDKYRPKQLNKVELHPHITIQLQKMSESGNIPHLLFYGPSGSGKKTRIITLLKEIYGSGIEKIKVEHRTIKIPNKSTTIELVTVASNYHIEMNPSDSGNQDRIVVQEIIKEIAQSQPLDISNQKPFKVVVLNEVDKLSKDAQHALRRTMEKYISSCRLILCCNSTSKVIEPVKSRCLAIRIPAPTNDEISQILSSIAKKEGLNVPNEIIKKILEQSNRNLRRAILIFEAAKTKQLFF